MENASKALIIAGNVLISLLVITVFVFGFTNLREYMSSKQDLEYIEQATDFNKQFDEYNRKGIYGSEFFTLVNLVENYNKKYLQSDGYTKLDIQVTFKKSADVVPFDINGTKIIKKDQTYNAEGISKILDDLEDGIKDSGNIVVGRYKVKDLAGKRTNELLVLLNNDQTLVDNCVSLCNTYSEYKSALSTLKGYTFDVKKFSYDRTNGRLYLMEFEKN